MAFLARGVWGSLYAPLSSGGSSDALFDLKPNGVKFHAKTHEDMRGNSGPFLDNSRRICSVPMYS